MFLNLKADLGVVIRKTGCILFASPIFIFCIISRGFSLFKLAGWPRRATIARGSQWVPKDLVAENSR